MTGRIPSLREASLGTQAALMLASVTFVAGVLTFTLVQASVLVALHGASVVQVERVRFVMLWAVALVMICTGVALLGAITYLRHSIRRTVRRMEHATAAIADGRFEHRIQSRRRDELGKLACSIDRMAERLQLLDTTRERMLASVSHELRTPLTVIRGHAFTLGRGECNQHRVDQFALIDTESERLTTMIDELLSAATLRAAPIELDRRDELAGSLIEGISQRFASLSSRREVILHCGTNCNDERVAVDRARLDQVIGNLVSNAIAHAPSGSTVEVSARLRGSSGLRVMVRNAGAEIAPERLPMIFEPFVQGDEPTGSVGLGLSIARDLVRAHGARLDVSSRDGRTEFWFDLQLIPEGARSVHQQLAPRFAI